MQVESNNCFGTQALKVLVPKHLDFMVKDWFKLRSVSETKSAYDNKAYFKTGAWHLQSNPPRLCDIPVVTKIRVWKLGKLKLNEDYP